MDVVVVVAIVTTSVIRIHTCGARRNLILPDEIHNLLLSLEANSIAFPFLAILSTCNLLVYDVAIVLIFVILRWP